MANIDVSHITQTNPAPILAELGWRPDGRKSGSWISATEASYSVFKARSGDWLCKPFPRGRTGNIIQILRDAECLSFTAAIERAERILAEKRDITAESLLKGDGLEAKPEPRRIDVEAITMSDPAPILAELGYSPDARERGKWVGGQLGSLSVFRATRKGGGAWLMLCHAHDKTLDIIGLLSECRGLTFVEAGNLAASILSLAPSPRQDLKSQHDAGPTPRPKISSAEATERYYRGGTVWTAGSPIPELLQSRGITALPAKWSDTFVVSDRGSIRTPFRGADGANITGFESIQADGSKHLLAGSTIGVVTSRLEAADEIVVTESMIDAMSFDLLAGPSRRGYMVVRSGAEDYLAAQLAGIMKMGQPIKRVTIATDNDAAGMLYASKIMARVDRLRVSPKHADDEDRFIADDFQVLYMPPIGRCNDHNDALRLALDNPSSKAGQRLQDHLELLLDEVAHSPMMAAE